MKKLFYLVTAIFVMAMIVSCDGERTSGAGKIGDVSFSNKGYVSKGIGGTISLPLAETMYWDVEAHHTSGDGYGEGTYQATTPGLPKDIKCSYGDWTFTLKGRTTSIGDNVLGGAATVTVDSAHADIPITISAISEDTSGEIDVNLSLEYLGTDYCAIVKLDDVVLFNWMLEDNDGNNLAEVEKIFSVSAGEHMLYFQIEKVSAHTIVEDVSSGILILPGLRTTINVRDSKGVGGFTLTYTDYEAIIEPSEE